MNIDLIAGARPNLMKIAPLYKALRRHPDVTARFIHTGQHYDHNLSDAFLEDFALPPPDIALNVGSGSHARQTARVMERYEPYCDDRQTDLVIVVGDVNSTLAAALTAKKSGRPVAHLEAGLRSGDRTMPEEINRLATDAISDVLWTPSPDADENLLREGHADTAITRVGNIMIDAFELVAPRIAQADMPARLGLDAGGYGVVTMHRPANVDDRDRLEGLCRALIACAETLPLVFPVHPRTRSRLEARALCGGLTAAGVRLVEPMGYVGFMSLVTGARIVITDSGGVQEETSYLGIPCVTIRPNTERPLTLSLGTNVLARFEDLNAVVAARLSATRPARPRIPLWDGQTAERTVADIATRFGLCAGDGDQ
jgi:UDP-N-acetylglucosamine 2-epimerase (non-hydrolysing)